jgi:hypothetical protein
MDLSACLKILAERKDAQAVQNGEAGAACPCCYDSSICGPVTTPADTGKSSSISEAGLRLLTSIELIDNLCLFQAERVQTYLFFQTELERLLAQDLLKHYPILCSQITETFNELSSNILLIKNEAEFRRQSILVQQITVIQAAEKEKLMYIAADHLNQMQNQIPQIQEISGGCEVQKTYLKGKVRECEQRISEALEEIQSLKVDMIEEENAD